MRFQWDPAKAAANHKKHDVRFADAVGVFYDDRALTLAEEHAAEERFITLGVDAIGRVLVVVYCWWGPRGADGIQALTTAKSGRMLGFIGAR